MPGIMSGPYRDPEGRRAERTRNRMTFFCEKEYEEIAQECGFHCVGNSRCFQARTGEAD